MVEIQVLGGLLLDRCGHLGDRLVDVTKERQLILRGQLLDQRSDGFRSVNNAVNLLTSLCKRKRLGAIRLRGCLRRSKHGNDLHRRQNHQ